MGSVNKKRSVACPEPAPARSKQDLTRVSQRHWEYQLRGSVCRTGQPSKGRSICRISSIHRHNRHHQHHRHPPCPALDYKRERHGRGRGRGTDLAMFESSITWLGKQTESRIGPRFLLSLRLFVCRICFGYVSQPCFSKDVESLRTYI